MRLVDLGSTSFPIILLKRPGQAVAAEPVLPLDPPRGAGRVPGRPEQPPEGVQAARDEASNPPVAQGGSAMKHKDSPGSTAQPPAQAKPQPPLVSGMLTDLEIEALRQDAKEASALMEKLLDERPDLRLK